MRSLLHMLELTATLQDRGVGLKVLKQNLDYADRPSRLPHPGRDR